MTKDQKFVVVIAICIIAVGVLVAGLVTGYIDRRSDASQRKVEQCIEDGGFPIIGGRWGLYKTCYFGDDAP